MPVRQLLMFGICGLSLILIDVTPSYSQTVASLTKENNSLRIEVVRQHKALEDYRADVERLKKTLAETQAELSGVRAERDANSTKINDLADHLQKTAVQRDSLNQTVRDLETAHAQLRSESVSLRQQRDNATTLLEQTRVHLQNLEQTTAERNWLMTWMKQRFPGTHGNEFNIEAIVEALGFQRDQISEYRDKYEAAKLDLQANTKELQEATKKNEELEAVLAHLRNTFGTEYDEALAFRTVSTSSASVPKPTYSLPTIPVSPGQMGESYLLVRMPEAGEVAVGGVSIPVDGRLYRLITVPVSAGVRSVALTANGSHSMVTLYVGRVTSVDAATGTLLSHVPVSHVPVSHAPASHAPVSHVPVSLAPPQPDFLP